MVINIMVPHFPALGSGGMPSLPSTILKSVLKVTKYPKIWKTPQYLTKRRHKKKKNGHKHGWVSKECD